ncbi:MAG TPA: methylated-DNA--[protein]-cysteine S-methyltransferase [Dehalococcoidia bacterium]|nr:methylated-DNA--[protein]-cysteine S-methyltransferase [Dehalococcoidia bacterium]
MSSFALESPIGLLLVEVTPRGLRRVDFLSRHQGVGSNPEVRVPFLSEPAAENGASVEEEALACSVEQQMRDYFDGSRRDFDLPLDVNIGSAFQRRVWQIIAQIPYGATASYAEVAAAAGSPGAFRAAGSACGNNPVALVVPCHRVVASGGRLGGYGGGLETKVWLLRHEGVSCSDVRSDARVRSTEPAALGV